MINLRPTKRSERCAARWLVALGCASGLAGCGNSVRDPGAASSPDGAIEIRAGDPTPTRGAREERSDCNSTVVICAGEERAGDPTPTRGAREERSDCNSAIVICAGEEPGDVTDPSG